MIKPAHGIKRGLFLGTCVVALGAVSGVTQAHVCMKKPYGQAYMTPMHPHGMQGYSGPMKPYGYPAQGYQAPAYQHTPGEQAYENGREPDSRTSANRVQTPAHEPDIIETATAAGNFNILIKAIVAADLYDTLRGEGPFTVFAPTDAAFAELPDGMLDGMLADKDMLVAVLGYHVVPGRLTAADLLQQRQLETVQGQTLSIDALDVVTADIETTNGIVHVISNVVVPSL